MILGQMNSIGSNSSIQYFRSGHYFLDIQYGLADERTNLFPNIVVHRYSNTIYIGYASNEEWMEYTTDVQEK